MSEKPDKKTNTGGEGLGGTKNARGNELFITQLITGHN